MKALIIGAGEVGFHLADRLSREGHDITVVDRHPEREALLRDKVNCNVVHGTGASAEVLEEAGIEGTDLFIAVTDADEVNMIACLIANEYNVPTKIARVKRAEYVQATGKLNAHRLGIELVINPQNVVAEEIVNMVHYYDAAEAAEFADRRVVFMSYPIQESNPMAGKSLRDLGARKNEAPFVITAIKRGDELLIPRGTDLIQPGDNVSFVCHKEDLPAIRTLFGSEAKVTKKIFILGAGRVGYEVARRLSEGNHKIKVIDMDAEQCQRVAERLEKVLVLCTNSMDVDTLKSEGIADCDAIIALTNDDQSNILSSLLAKKYGAKRAVVLVNEPELVKLANSLGIDACVSPRLSTASAILKHIRRGNVLSMVEQSNAEVLELQLTPESKILNKPIHTLSVPNGAIIGAIVRGEKVIIPGGDDHLEDQDRIIVFTLLKSIQKVEKFFS